VVTKQTISHSSPQDTMCKTNREISMILNWASNSNLVNNCKLTISSLKGIQKMLMCNRIANNRTLMMKPIWQLKESKSSVLQQKMLSNNRWVFLLTSMHIRMTIKISRLLSKTKKFRKLLKSYHSLGKWVVLPKIEVNKLSLMMV